MTARTVAGFLANGQVTIAERGEPVRKPRQRRQPSAAAEALEAALLPRLPERNVLDILANINVWTQWTRPFGPPSGVEPRFADPTQRYLLRTFAPGCNVSPAQAARHMQSLVTAHALSFANRRHLSIPLPDAAVKNLINASHRCDLRKVWGTGASAAADGDKYDLAENRLLAEYAIRYGRCGDMGGTSTDVALCSAEYSIRSSGRGGTAYHPVADTDIASFSHFIPGCVWKARKMGSVTAVPVALSPVACGRLSTDSKGCSSTPPTPSQRPSAAMPRPSRPPCSGRLIRSASS